MEDWLTIESAPKDRPIIAYNAMVGEYPTMFDGKNFPCRFWGREGNWYPVPSHWRNGGEHPRTLPADRNKEAGR